MHTKVPEALIYRSKVFLRLEKILHSGLNPGLHLGPPGTLKHSEA